MLSLLLGGARSGKSELAEKQAAGLLDALPGPRRAPASDPPTVTYVATAQVTDGEMAVRVDAHRRRRPARWDTVEVGPGADLSALLLELPGVVLIDSLGPWVAGFDRFVFERDRFPKALRLRKGPTVVVSEEVGLGVHPSTEAGRLFRDALGELNRLVASLADEVWLVVAGIPTRLGGTAPFLGSGRV